LNTIRVTAEAEREWLRRLQEEPGQDFETKAIERAVKAGAAAIKSDRHISKKQRSSDATNSIRESNPQASKSKRRGAK
jgi:hypothetical protein